MRTDRVFVDTNVLLSGLIFDGNESKLLELAVSGEIRLVLADAVLEEAHAVLESKFPNHADVLQRFLSLVRCERVEMPDDAQIESARSMSRDPGDSHIIASIVLCHPDCVVTGDKDLLTKDARETLGSCRCSDYLARRALAPKRRRGASQEDAEEQ